METISLSNYTIFIGDIWEALDSFIQQNGYNTIFCLVDENTKEHCWPILKKNLSNREFHLVESQSGEENKHLESCKDIWNQLQEGGADRSSLLINLGGGVIGDMGGFCASTYMRGIDFIQIPTTLLSQVDSSIGGKLGIDFNAHKNFIGLFKDPKAVFIFSPFLETLIDREWKSGFAEVLKHGLIADPSLWKDAKDIQSLKNASVEDWLIRALLVKKQIVEKDPYEKGMRKILNFGHSIGHAIESCSMKLGKRLLHGEAIAIGMVCESFISHRLLGLSLKELLDIQSTFLNVFGKEDIKQYKKEDVFAFLKLDKKNQGQELNFSLIKSIGTSSYNEKVDSALILESLHSYSDL